MSTVQSHHYLGTYLLAVAIVAAPGLVSVAGTSDHLPECLGGRSPEMKQTLRLMDHLAQLNATGALPLENGFVTAELANELCREIGRCRHHGCLNDGWGKPLQVRHEGLRLVFRSAGPDRIYTTPDDVKQEYDP